MIVSTKSGVDGLDGFRRRSRRHRSAQGQGRSERRATVRIRGLDGSGKLRPQHRRQPCDRVWIAHARRPVHARIRGPENPQHRTPLPCVAASPRCPSRCIPDGHRRGECSRRQSLARRQGSTGSPTWADQALPDAVRGSRTDPAVVTGNRTASDAGILAATDRDRPRGFATLFRADRHRGATRRP